MTSTAEWIGSGVLGISALALVATAARFGASSAHAAADAECAAYDAQRPATTPEPTPAPFVWDIPPMPLDPPAVPAHVDTLEIPEVLAYRARHRKEPACS